MKNFIVTTSWKQKVTPEVVVRHVDFLRALAAKGQFILAGPFVGAPAPEAGIFMFKAESTEAALELLDTDPFVAEGFQSFELREVKIATEENDFVPE
ncbi:MAG: YciI family protein [Streptococcaceae bacterium]|jgi:uncharacterized protein YciI|nr:YciI family protein [Streptococcaceae bacterium]